jgi:aspartate ammonia-lyase
LRVACEALSERCIPGISIVEDRVRDYAVVGLGELTEAASVLGYEESSRLARDADRAGISPTEVVRRQGVDAAGDF